MKIKNLADYPQQLGDDRVIGASGTKQDTREYDLPELTKEDKRRVKDGTLAVVEEVEPEKVEPEKTAKVLSEGESFVDSSGKEKLPLVNAENNEAGTKGKSNGGKK